MGALEERRRIREDVVRRAREWAHSLPFRATVILVGSYARGDFNVWSDVDVLLIAEFTGSPLERLKSIDYPAGFEVIPLTHDEFIRLFSKGNPLAMEALSTGVLLRDDFGVSRLKLVNSQAPSFE